MRVLHHLSVVLCLLAVPISLHGAEEAQGAKALQERVRAADRQRLAAMVASDVQTLDRLLDDCLRYHHSNGTTDTKDSLLKSLRSGAVRYLAIEPGETSVHLRGPDVAEVNTRADFKVALAERTLDLDLEYTATWNLISGDWKMVDYRSRAVDE